MHFPEKQVAKLSIDELLDKYEQEQPKKPNALLKGFKSKEEFRQWCEEGTKEDLECTLKAFEESEAYEWCGIINEVLKGKGNE